MTGSEHAPEFFSTARLRAERLTSSHFDELLRMHADAAVMAFLGGVRDRTQTIDYLEQNLRHWAEHGCGVWIVRDLGSGDIIGRAVLRHLTVDGVDEVEIGYAFYRPFWGRGLATEVANACVAMGREQLQRSTLVAVTSPDNLGSQHVLRKCGFVRDRELVRDTDTSLLFRVSWAAQAD